MSQHFSSRIQVLTVENEDRKSKRTGNEYKHFVARAILLADDGEVVTVGALRVPPSLREQVKVGTFRASFSLQVPDYGDDKGDIVAVLTQLVPEQLAKAAANAPAAAKAA